MRQVTIVGAGLIGTSIGLALRRQGSYDVVMWDRHEDRARMAADLGAGRAAKGALAQLAPAEHLVVAVPPSVTALVVSEALQLGLASTISDVAAIKADPLAEVQALSGLAHLYCGGHPMAGSEQSGPAAARADLFDGRAWAVTPTPTTDPAARTAALEIAEACGAVPVELSPEAHDDAVALVSHTPQLVASLLAALLPAADDLTVQLAGQGLRDTTRIAASDPELWAQIVPANARHVVPLLARLRERLDHLLGALSAAASDASQASRAADAVAGLLGEGNLGRARLPGKHGARRLDLSTVSVVIPDTPGQLARLLADASAVGINIEDLSMEHALGRPFGAVQLAVQPAGAEPLAAALTARGWTAYASI